MKHARNAGPDLAFRLGRRVVTAVVDDMSTTQRVGAGVVAALVAISPFGAWSKAEAQADPLAVGTPVEVGPFEVTVEKAATADKLGHLVPQPGNHMLAVVAHVTNTGDVPEYPVTLGGAVPAPEDVGIVPEEPLDGLGTDAAAESPAPDAGTGADTTPSASPSPGEAEEPELPAPTIVNIKDGTSLSILNPGVTYRVALIWEQSSTWSGEAVPIDMLELEWIEESALSLDNGYWLPGETAYHGQIPVNADESEQAGNGADGSRPAGSAEAGKP